MKILLIYYTGTYNTRFITKRLKAHLINNNYLVTTLEINDDTEVIDTTSYDLIGLGYPIYGFNSPLPFNKYLKKLKFKVNQKYFIYKDSGETWALNNASSRVIKRVMKENKAILVGEYHLTMPYNIHFPYSDNLIKQILDYNEKSFELMVYNLKHDIIKTIDSNFLYNLGSFFVSIQKIGGPLNSFFYKVDTTKCDKCLLCLKSCPHHNIYLKNGEIKFHHHCQMCMRCSFYCPHDAIKIGLLNHWRVNGSYHLEKLFLLRHEYKPEITSETLGFYKCFYQYFKKIDKEYAHYQELK